MTAPLLILPLFTPPLTVEQEAILEFVKKQTLRDYVRAHTPRQLYLGLDLSGSELTITGEQGKEREDEAV